MSFGNITRKKLRAKIIRKGIFTQLKYSDVRLEREHRLFRTVLDYALYDVTGKHKNKKLEVLKWLNLKDQDFQMVCHLAGLNPRKTYVMFLYFLKNYFNEIYEEHSCLLKGNGAILSSQPHHRS